LKKITLFFLFLPPPKIDDGAYNYRAPPPLFITIGKRKGAPSSWCNTTLTLPPFLFSPLCSPEVNTLGKLFSLFPLLLMSRVTTENCRDPTSRGNLFLFPFPPRSETLGWTLFSFSWHVLFVPFEPSPKKLPPPEKPIPFFFFPFPSSTGEGGREFGDFFPTFFFFGVKKASDISFFLLPSDLPPRSLPPPPLLFGAEGLCYRFLPLFFFFNFWLRSSDAR